MSIIPSEIKYYKSATSTSLGGAITATELSGAANDLFDPVTGDEADSGDIEYRCIYVKNTNGTIPLGSPRVFILTNTPSTFTDIEIGLGVSAIDGVEPSVADENSAPVGVVFSLANGYSNGLAFPTLSPGQYKAVWLRRNVDIAARAYNSDSVIISTTGYTS